MRRLVMVGMVLVAAAGWWFWGRTVEPVRVIRAQLAAIQQADYNAAYTYLAPDAQQRLPPEEFRAMVRQNGAVGQVWDTTFLSRKVRDDLAIIQGHITGRDGKAHEVRYILAKLDDTWRIRSFQW